MPHETERLRELKLKWVVEDYPELARAFRDGDYWVHPDGGIEMHVVVPDSAWAREGIRRWSDALGIPLQEVQVQTSAPPGPRRPALAMGEAAALSRKLRSGEGSQPPQEGDGRMSR